MNVKRNADDRLALGGPPGGTTRHPSAGKGADPYKQLFSQMPNVKHIFTVASTGKSHMYPW